MPLQRIRNSVSAFLAVTMLATSVASAAPAAGQVDPMVALSLLGTAESRAAVCSPGSGGAACQGALLPAAAAGSAAAATAGAGQDPGTYDGRTARGSMMPLWVALAVVLAGWAWIILDDDDDDDDVDLPESPA